MSQNYPLHWPEGWHRTNNTARTRGKFRTKARSNWKQDLTVSDGADRVLDELDKLGVEDMNDIIISTNIEPTLSGRPRPGRAEPDDPGVAVYWLPLGSLASDPMKVIAIDRYDRVADNLAAIAATLNAMRAIERHGGAEILERAFTGFVALPGADDGWRSILEYPQSLGEAETNYTRLRFRKHPDQGGSNVEFIELQEAIKQAREYFK